MADHEYLRNIMAEETKTLQCLCATWKNILTNPSLPNDVIGEINVAIGQSDLIIKERFSQFSTLIDDSQYKRKEKEITIDDLRGFWDIVYIQVEKIKNNFKRLNEMREQNWTEPTKENVEPQKRNVAVKRKPAGVPYVGITNSSRSSLKNHIMAARKKLKTNAVVTKNDSPKSVKEFEGGFFKVLTPVRENRRSNKIKEGSTAPLPNRSEVHMKDYSPCMRITRSMKKQQTKTVLQF